MFNDPTTNVMTTNVCFPPPCLSTAHHLWIISKPHSLGVVLVTIIQPDPVPLNFDPDFDHNQKSLSLTTKPIQILVHFLSHVVMKQTKLQHLIGFQCTK